MIIKSDPLNRVLEFRFADAADAQTFREYLALKAMERAHAGTGESNDDTFDDTLFAAVSGIVYPAQIVARLLFNKDGEITKVPG